MRWRRPDGQLTPPEVFIPVAEDAGLIGSIGGWVLRQACADAQRWHTDHGVVVFVNIAGRRLDHPGFAGHVVNAIDQAGLSSDALVLEITEGSLLTASTGNGSLPAAEVTARPEGPPGDRRLPGPGTRRCPM